MVRPTTTSCSWVAAGRDPATRRRMARGWPGRVERIPERAAARHPGATGGGHPFRGIPEQIEKAERVRLPAANGVRRAVRVAAMPRDRVPRGRAGGGEPRRVYPLRFGRQPIRPARSRRQPLAERLCGLVRHADRRESLHAPVVVRGAVGLRGARDCVHAAAFSVSSPSASTS